MTRIAALFVLFFSSLSPAQSAEPAVTVFAAASLRGALEEIAAGYEGEVRLSFGGSGTMARQVAAGAPVDVVILANTLWMDWLVDQGITDGTAPVMITGNALALIAPADMPPLENLRDVPARLEQGRLAMGQREAVPAGRYAQQWLKAVRLWDDMQGRLAETDNVRAALALVARGDAPLGIVYGTDARAEERVQIVWHIASDLHDPIVYPAVTLTPEGHRFLPILSQPDAVQVFQKHGFLPVTQ